MIRRLLAACIATGTLLTAAAHADSWADKRPRFGGEKKKNKSAPARADEDDAWSGHSPLLDNDILIGAKAGPQITSYTDVTVGGSNAPLDNGLGYAAGGALLWNLGFPRLEADVLVQDRKQGDRIPVVYVAMPLLVKTCVAENKRVSWSVGTGMQLDLAVSGGGTKRNVAIGIPVATDLLIRLNAGPYLDFEVRYDIGLQTYDTGTTGGRPRDLDVLLGFLVPIDRTGF